ncbi:MAG: sporulation initiation inhibitor Soj [bacterium]|nr:MAG: sporulation initiation inhibitor Soj [bacterium]
MRKIAFVNEKGGSGKTTLTINVGAWLALQGKKVLLLDMDPQGHVGKSLGVNVNKTRSTVFDLLIYPDAGIEDTIIPTNNENLFLIPSNKRLTDFVINVSDHDDRHIKLKNKVDHLEGYDYLLIDSPPSLGLLAVNILLAAEEIVIPVSLTYLALDGCAEILDTILVVRANFGHDSLKVSLVVPTFFRNTILVQSILNKLKNNFGGDMSQTIVKFDMKLDQAQSFGKTIFEFAPDSLGAKMMAGVAREVMAIGG